jgi:hypothetical protein
VYQEGDFCNVELVELDPEDGCLTFTPLEDVLVEESDEWDELYEEEESLYSEDEDDDDGYDPSEWN